MLPRVNLIATDIGQYLLLATPDLISTHLLLQGTWEPWQLSISQLLLEGIEAPHVVDVGANLGAYAIPVGNLIAPQRGRLTAFEAQRLIHLQLCGNVFLNRLDNVTPHHFAIGDHDGELALPKLDYRREINIGALSTDASIRQLQQQSSTCAGATDTEAVALRKLDSLALGTITLLKVDVEGCELEVIRGAVHSLEASHWPPILFELWSEAQCPWFTEKRAATLSRLKELGYQVFTFGQSGLAQHPKHPRQFAVRHTESGGLKLTRER